MNEKKIMQGDVRLNEDELAGVSGGAFNALDDIHSKYAVRSANNNGVVKDASTAAGAATQPHFCKKCNKTTAHNVYSGGRMACSECGTTPFM